MTPSDTSTNMRRGPKRLVNCARTLLVIFIPILLMFIIIIPHVYQPRDTHQVKFSFQMGWVYILFLVGFYWMFNVFHISTTSFIIPTIIPLMGIIPAKAFADSLMSDHNVAIFGSVVLMLAADTCGLRRRVTLMILKHSSGSIRWIFIDIYLATLWIAMWINSSAATYLMMKVIDDMLQTLKAEIPNGIFGGTRLRQIGNNQGKSPKDNGPSKDVEATKELDTSANDKTVDEVSTAKSRTEEQSKELTSQDIDKENEVCLNDFGGELLYCTAVAANIGGILWPYGNPMGYDIMRLRYTVPKVKTGPFVVIGLTEASWIIYMLPLLIINASVGLWFLLLTHFGKSSTVINFFRPKTQHLTDILQSEECLKNAGATFSKKYSQLPKWNSKEKSLVVLIIIMIILCLTRHPVFMTGWSERIRRRFDPLKVCDGLRLSIGDSVSLIIVVLMLFILPAWGLEVFKGPPPADKKKSPPAPSAKLTWKKLQTFYPFTTMILIGASTAMGRFSDKPFVAPMSKHLARTIQGTSTSTVTLKLVMISFTLAMSFFLPNPGTSAAIMDLWYTMMVGYKGKVHGASILPILSVASLCFVIPSSSIPTALVYRYQGDKTLTAWHFLRLGLPLFLCTLIPTVLYALLWSSNSLSVIFL